MENYFMVIFSAGCAVFLVGIVFTTYQMFAFVKEDAHCRNLPHPKLWRTIALSGNNASGLILYLIKRRNYPIVSQTMAQKKQMDSHKKKCGIGIAFMAVGAIVSIWGLTLGNFS